MPPSWVDGPTYQPRDYGTSKKAKSLGENEEKDQLHETSAGDTDFKTPPEAVVSKAQQLIETYGDLPPNSGEWALEELDHPTPEMLLALLLNAVLSLTHISHTIAGRTITDIMKAGIIGSISLKRVPEKREHKYWLPGYTRYRYVTTSILFTFYCPYLGIGRKLPPC